MHKFLQGDLVTIHTDKIPNTEVPVKEMFPLEIGIVSYTTSSRDNDFEFIHLIPVTKIHANRMTQEEHIKWIRKKFTTVHGRLIRKEQLAKNEDAHFLVSEHALRVSSWFFYEKTLRIFQFSEEKYFDDNLFEID